MSLVFLNSSFWPLRLYLYDLSIFCHVLVSVSYVHSVDASSLTLFWSLYCICYLDYHNLNFYPSTKDLYECQQELINYYILVSRTCHFHWYQWIWGRHLVEVFHCNSAASWIIFRSTPSTVSEIDSILALELLLMAILYISGCFPFFWASMLSVFYDCSQNESARKSVNLSVDHQSRKDRFA